MEIELNLPDLDPEVVQIAIFETDPIERYKKDLASVRTKAVLRSMLGLYADPAAARAHVRAAYRSMAWDRLFAEIPGDRVHLLCGRTLSSTIRSFSSNSAQDRHWIASKLYGPPDGPLCWSVGVETKPRACSHVILDGKNAVDLVTLSEPYLLSALNE
mgnify:FL=1